MYKRRTSDVCSICLSFNPHVLTESYPSSFSCSSRCVTRHLNVTFHVDFDSHVIRAQVSLTVEVLQDRLSVLTLDTRDLKIVSVSANGQAAAFSLGPRHSFKGAPLDITLPFDLSRGQHVIVEVTYETSPSAVALQWLAPEQTAGKKHPVPVQSVSGSPLQEYSPMSGQSVGQTHLLRTGVCT
ncbi:unnamed protein product [Pleuronectes platessa]|uniref:Leukotriene A4 hydrolase n=1 Tax=Pleuronectes platessa TaxID=8262 RepID=A0A9N7YR40_PLEPL|nr:unnamed protein product [Pleuronectes platessa]